MPRNRDDFVILDKRAVEAILEYRRMSLKAVARILCRDDSEVRRWKNGHVKPTRKNAKELADALGCEIEHLEGVKTFVPEGRESGYPTGAVGRTIQRGDGVSIIKIEEHLDEAKLLELAHILQRIAGIGGEARVVGKGREGCMEFTLQLTREQWLLLDGAFAEDKFEHLGVREIGPFYEFRIDDSEKEAEEPKDPGNEAPASATRRVGPTQVIDAMGANEVIAGTRGPTHPFVAQCLTPDQTMRKFPAGSVHWGTVGLVEEHRLKVLLDGESQFVGPDHIHPRSKRSLFSRFRVGDSVKIKVDSVQMIEGHVELGLSIPADQMPSTEQDMDTPWRTVAGGDDYPTREEDRSYEARRMAFPFGSVHAATVRGESAFGLTVEMRDGSRGIVLRADVPAGVNPNVGDEVGVRVIGTSRRPEDGFTLRLTMKGMSQARFA